MCEFTRRECPLREKIITILFEADILSVQGGTVVWASEICDILNILGTTVSSKMPSILKL